MLLIGPPTPVLVAAGALLLVVAELVVQAVVVLLVDVVLLIVFQRPVSRAMMTMMLVKVPFHPSNQTRILAFNSLDTSQGAPSQRLILFLNFFLIIV